MKLTSVLSGAQSLLRAKFLGARIPLAVTWQLTSQCNLRCKYCGVWDNPISELSTNDVTAALTKLRNYGTQYISFTGGEPLLRDDIGDIVQFAVSRGFLVSLSTNGYFVPDKINQLKGLSDLKMSFDGPKNIHDQIRGVGSYDKLMCAIESCNVNGIKPSMQCVLSKNNLHAVDYILETAKKLNFKVMFQPATEDMLWTEDINLEAPPVEEYRKTITKLIQSKKKGCAIRNSIPGLRHMLCWPDQKPIYCSAGVLSCDLLPDGSLISCFRYDTIEAKTKHNDHLKALNSVEKSPSCQQCWCGGLVEFNLMASFNVQAILNWFKNF